MLLIVLVVCHGANPGLAETMTKQGILDIAAAVDGVAPAIPKTRQEWAALCHRLNIRVRVPWV